MDMLPPSRITSSLIRVWRQLDSSVHLLMYMRLMTGIIYKIHFSCLWFMVKRDPIDSYVNVFVHTSYGSLLCLCLVSTLIWRWMSWLYLELLSTWKYHSIRFFYLFIFFPPWCRSVHWESSLLSQIAVLF